MVQNVSRLKSENFRRSSEIFQTSNDLFSVLGLQNQPKWLLFTITSILTFIGVLFVQFFVVPRQKEKLLKIDVEGSKGDGLSSRSINENVIIVDELFNFLQILSAVFTSFAHGGEFGFLG